MKRVEIQCVWRDSPFGHQSKYTYIMTCIILSTIYIYDNYKYTCMFTKSRKNILHSVILKTNLSRLNLPKIVRHAGQVNIKRPQTPHGKPVTNPETSHRIVGNVNTIQGSSVVTSLIQYSQRSEGITILREACNWWYIVIQYLQYIKLS